MMKCICRFYESSKKAINESEGESKITWALIENQLAAQILLINKMKFMVILS